MIEKITMKGRTDVSIMVAALILSCVGADGREHNLHKSKPRNWQSVILYANPSPSSAADELVPKTMTQKHM